MKRGSITLEAAVILPIFIMLCLRLLTIFNIMLVFSQIQASIYEVNKKAVKYQYAIEKNQRHNIDNLTYSIMGINNFTLKSEVKNYLYKIGFNEKQISRGYQGMSFLNTKIMNKNECYDINVTYRVRPFFKDKEFGNATILNRCNMRAWTGYDIEKQSKEKAQNQIVYITESGSVYHTDKKCTHLVLRVQSIQKEEIVNLRNDNGGKYYSCLLCNSLVENATYYITKEGNRYHRVDSCSGIKRTVQAVFYFESPYKIKCSRCG